MPLMSMADAACPSQSSISSRQEMQFAKKTPELRQSTACEAPSTSALHRVGTEATSRSRNLAMRATARRSTGADRAVSIYPCTGRPMASCAGSKGWQGVVPTQSRVVASSLKRAISTASPQARMPCSSGQKTKSDKKTCVYNSRICRAVNGNISQIAYVLELSGQESWHW